jgi:acetyl-CoA synthetase (ADP-forming)
MRSSEEILKAAVAEKRTALYEHEAKEIVRSLGIIVPRSEVAAPGREEGLIAAADRLGYPLALKAASPSILHKTEAGAVVVDIRNKAELLSAARQISSAVTMRVPGATIHHFLIEKMMPPGLEVLVGGMRDAQFGASIAFGLGGVWTEALQEVVFGILPMTREEVGAMMDRTKASLFFRGFRGAPPLDREAVYSIITGVSKLMHKHEEIREIDLNPVRVYPRSAAALDARILLAL